MRIDHALDGRLKRELSARSRGNTYRSEAVRLASPAPLMWLGFDIGLGPFADVPLARWQEAFVPMRLADSLREATNSDGRPLVAIRTDAAAAPHRAGARGVRRAMVAVAAVGPCRGVRASCCSAASSRVDWRQRQSRLWAVCTLLGLLMLFIWFGTAHRAGWANQNLLLLNPLCLLLLPGDGGDCADATQGADSSGCSA